MLCELDLGLAFNEEGIVLGKLGIVILPLLDILLYSETLGFSEP